MLIRSWSGRKLFGTMHLLPESYAAKLKEVVRPLVERCTSLVLECDLPPLGYEPPHARLPKGERLEALVPAGLYSSIVEAGDAQGLSADDISTSSPWWAAERLGLATIRALGLSGKNSVESAAREHAQAMGRRVEFLENLDRGYISRSQAPLSEQLWLLESVVRRPEENRAELIEMVRAFASGTAEAWEKILVDGSSHQPETTDDLFRRRNLEWLPSIESELERGRPLVVIGALHLVGANGILALLRDHGFRLER